MYREPIEPISHAESARRDLAELAEAERALAVGNRERISHAEFSRFVQEATEQRERAERAEADVATLGAALAATTADRGRPPPSPPMSPTYHTVEIAGVYEPRDLWIGLYYRLAKRRALRRLRLYICLLPCWPIRVTLTWRSTCPDSTASSPT